MDIQSQLEALIPQLERYKDGVEQSSDAMSKLDRMKKDSAAAAVKAAEESSNAMKAAGLKAAAALFTFSSTLLSANQGASKYNGALSSAGDAALQLGSQFGAVGAAIGLSIKAFTFLLGEVNKLTDGLTSFRDETTKITGVLPTTLEGLSNLATNAKYSGERMAVLQKITAGVGTSLVALGGNAGTGALKFMEMANVGDDVRKKFGMMGVSQEALTSMQAQYVEMQGASGQAYVMQNKSMKQLQTESLAYADNMTRLSSLTGKSAADLQKQQEQVQMSFEEQLKIRMENVQMRDLEKSATEARAKGDFAAADRLEKQKHQVEAEQTLRTNLMRETTSKFGTETGNQIGRLLRTGVYDKVTGPLATMGVDFVGMSNKIKNIDPGTDITKLSKELSNNLTNGLDKGMDNFATNLGPAALTAGEGVGKAFGVGTEMMISRNKAFGKTAEEQDKIIEENKKRALENNKIAESDETRKKAERDIQAKYQEQMIKLSETILPVFTSLFVGINAILEPTVKVFEEIFKGYVFFEKIVWFPFVKGFEVGIKTFNALLPAIKLVTQVVTDLVKLAMVPFSSALKTGATYMDSFFKLIKNIMDKLSFITKPFSSVTNAVSNSVGGMFSKAAGGIGDYASKQVASLHAAANAPDVGRKTQENLQAVGKTGIGRAASGVASIGSGIVDSINNPYETAGSAIKDAAGNMVKTGSGNVGPPGGQVAGGSSMSDDDLKKMIMSNEGVRTKPYKDSLGLWTVGVGHLIGDGKTLPPEWNKEISNDDVMRLFDDDFSKHKMAASNIPGFDKLSTGGQGALTDMTFNMGPSWFKQWPNFTKQLSMGNAQAASDNILQSKYAKQVGRRAANNAALIGSSKVQGRTGGIANGPLSGYPATLHGNEAIVPLDPNSILAELGKKPTLGATEGNKIGGDSMQQLISINQGMVEILSNKLDSVIDHLSASNNTQSKILKRTSV